MPKTEEGAKYQKRYTEENVLAALQAIEDGMSQRLAAKTYNVPRQTLQFRLSDKFNNKTSLGPNPYLTNDEERLLEEWILDGCRKGYPVRKYDIQASVKEFLDANIRDNPFRNNFPGDGWYKAFLKRHPILTQRTAEAVTAASAQISEENIRKWFTSVEDYLREKNLNDILLDPSRMFNGDETCFVLCPKNTKVLAPKGTKNVYEVDSSQAKTTLTVMFTFSAAGVVTDPMIIYPYKRIPTNIVNSVPKGWGIGHSDNGWMKTELFYEYIGNVLYPCLKKLGVKFPIILFVDGHTTHQTYKLSQLCTELQIVLIALYPNATRIMQPADVAAFKPLKTGWKKAVLEFRRKNPRSSLTKESFAPVVKTVVDECAKIDTIKNGFRASGLFPWDASAIDYTKCLGKNNITDNDESGQNDENDDVFISFSQFKNIVGEQRINMFKQIDNVDEINTKDDFQVLYRLYKQFGISGTDKNKNENIAENIDIENLDIIFADDMTHLDSTSSELTLEALVTDLPTEISNDQSKIFVNTENNDVIDAIDSETSVQQTREENNNSSFIGVKDNNHCSSTYEAVNLNTSLREYIVWPKTPERKGKKQTERMPFVLTSSTWKELQQQKMDNKKEEEQKKAARKEERILKKQQKEKEKVDKTKQSKKRKISVRETTNKKVKHNIKQEDKIDSLVTNTEEKDTHNKKSRKKLNLIH